MSLLKRFLTSKDIGKLGKASDRGLKTFYGTDDGKAFFKVMRLLYVDRVTFDKDNINDTIYNLAKKELIEELYLKATNQSIIEPMENPNE